MTKNVTEKIHNELAPGIKEGHMNKVFDAATREDVVESSNDVRATRASHSTGSMEARRTTDNG